MKHDLSHTQANTLFHLYRSMKADKKFSALVHHEAFRSVYVYLEQKRYVIADGPEIDGKWEILLTGKGMRLAEELDKEYEANPPKEIRRSSVGRVQRTLPI